MLYTQTVTNNTLDLLNLLMQDEKLSDFILAGGTNLSLRLGHRLSFDLDMFSPVSFDGTELQQYLVRKYNIQISTVFKNGSVVGTIDGIKTDFIAHVYSQVKPPVITEQGFRLYSLEDITAMKLAAIGDDGTRLKDFVDVAYLSTQLPLEQMLEAYTSKYPNTSPYHAIKGLSYYDDIEFDVNIVLTRNRKFDWKKIEQRILQMIKYETKVFEAEPI
jgi:predicted nucleotidyltransferase component of viral defense system